MRYATLLCALGLGACAGEAAEAPVVEQAPANAQATPASSSGGWNPHSPFTEQQLEQLCNNPEAELTPPPENGFCMIEIRLTETELTTGQGASDGRGEISILAGANPDGLPDSYTESGTISEQIYNPGQGIGQELDLGTFKVAVGTTRDVELCLYATERDNGGSNGGDDKAWGCETVTLRCRATDANGDGFPDGAASEEVPVGPRPLCGKNNCNGSMSWTFEIMAADADMDDIPNDEDVTPELCDEERKGEEGRAALFYYHFDDGGVTELVRAMGLNFSAVYSHYDRVVLVADQATSNPGNINARMFANADRVYPPTREGLVDAIQYLTAEGMRFDTFVAAHGYESGSTDASFEVLSGDLISGDWLTGAMDPDHVGTAEHGIPIMAWWSTTCIAARQIDAWVDIGAVATSGADAIEFRPNAWGPFISDWVSGTPYRTAVEDSHTAGVIGVSELLVGQQGADAPFLCLEDDPTTPKPWDGPGGVLQKNACAEDFFNDDVGPNEAKYNIEDIYDHALSGAQNMALSSHRTFEGNDNATFGVPGHTWP